MKQWHSCWRDFTHVQRQKLSMSAPGQMLHLLSSTPGPIRLCCYVTLPWLYLQMLAIEDDGHDSSSEGSTVDIRLPGEGGESLEFELEESMEPDACFTYGEFTCSAFNIQRFILCWLSVRPTATNRFIKRAQKYIKSTFCIACTQSSQLLCMSILSTTNNLKSLDHTACLMWFTVNIKLSGAQL